METEIVNERNLSPAEEWISWLTKQMADAVAPHGFKKHKTGAVISKLDFLTQKRCEDIINFVINTMKYKDARNEQDLNTELLKLRDARVKTDEKLRAAKKKWFNWKEIKSLQTQAEQIGSMAVGIDRAVRLIRVVKRLPDEPAEKEPNS